jgi:hypothetical protein
LYFIRKTNQEVLSCCCLLGINMHTTECVSVHILEIRTRWFSVAEKMCFFSIQKYNVGV